MGRFIAARCAEAEVVKTHPVRVEGGYGTVDRSHPRSSYQMSRLLTPGQPVATIVPGSSTGIEIGFAAGQGESSYASVYGGGYSEGQLTAAGQAFSNLLASLGAPAGLAEGRQVTGHFP